MDEYQELLATPDLVTRIKMASAAMDERRRAMSRLAAIRGHALVELRQSCSVTQIADQLGITRQHVHRLLREALGRDYQPDF